MKNYLFIIIVLFLGLSLNAQAPQGFNYQATVRNSSGDLVVNTNVYFKFNIIQGSQTAVPIYTETHYVPTDDLGQVNLVIGQGTANNGVFSELDWSLGSYYLGIELDTGNGYIAMGTTQLLSVPYALYAANSGNTSASIPDGINAGDILVWDGVNWSVTSNNSNVNQIEITTVEIYQINSDGGISGGDIGSDGGASITAKGVVWSEDPNPSVDLITKTNEGPGASSFTSSISDLTPLTNYFYRAYATNSFGSFYGNTFNFTTSDILPTVITKPVLEISYYSVNSGLEITNLGSDIVRSGIIYSRNQQLLSVNGNNNIIEGDGVLSIENLTPGTIYYVRAFAENSVGVAYGEIISFETLTDDLTVTNGQHTNLTFNGVEIIGNSVNNDGSLAIIERGVIVSEYYQGLNLASNLPRQIVTSGTGTGEFNANFSQLSPNVNYFYRAFAKNEEGIIAYGLHNNNLQFTTPFNYGSVTDIDQNTYNTVTLGNQVWMAENLKVTRFNDGTNLTQSTSSQFWYSNDNVNNSLYSSIEGGVYYNSSVVNANYNICPQGWRIPTLNDWEILISNLDYADAPVRNLMSSIYEWQLDGVPNGFNLKLYGAISADGVWYNFGQSTSLWLSNYKVAFEKSNPNYSLEEFSYGDKGVCIRCIKD
ncbi:MAG: fibrobacter succinogenes major paralogous domain-containing protein [Flavobacteriaceae bacterium]